MRFAVKSLVLLALTMPLLADSAEHLVGTTISTPAPHNRGLAAMATDGTDFFVVWSDVRAETRESLVGTRVRGTGQVLDPLGIRIAVPNRGVQHPNVVWDGGAYLVTWNEGWDSASLFAARVDRDGRIVMAPRVIAPNAMATSGQYAASNGNVTVVAYRSLDYDAPPIRAVVLDHDGNALDHQTILATSQNYISPLSVAATASHFAVVWSAYLGDQIHTATTQAVMLTAGGELAKGPTPIGVGGDPAVGTDGSRFLVLSWHRLDETPNLLSRTVDETLTQVTPAQTLSAGHTLESPSVLWRGSHYEIVAGRVGSAGEPTHLYSIDADADGKKLAERSLGAVTSGYSPITPDAVAATNGSDLMVAFAKAIGVTSDGIEIFGRVYETNAITPKVEQLLTWSGNAHNNPDVTSSAAGTFVAWQESDGVYATRIDANGVSLDGRGIRLSEGSWRPRVAFNGTHYVVAWIEWYQMTVCWVSPETGQIASSVEIPTLWTNTFAMTTSPDATYLAYIGDEDQRLKVMRIPHSTHVPDATPVIVSPEEMFVDMPALSWNGSTLLVAWNEIYIPRGDPPIALAVKTHAARVSAGLTLLDPAPLLIAETRDEYDSTFGTPFVASNGAGWLIVTTKGLNDILARRVLNNGTVEGSAPVKIAEGFAPVAAFDGTRYAVAWQGGEPSWPPDSPIVLASVPSSGALVASGRAIVATHVTSDAPAIAPTSTGEIAVVYTKLSFAPEHTGVERSYMRLMDSRAGRGRVVRR